MRTACLIPHFSPMPFPTRWIHHLERRFGSLAIPGLIRIVVVFNALVYLLLQAKTGQARLDFLDTLTLRPDRVMAGEVWRLVTYLFIPQVSTDGVTSVVWVFFYLNLLWVFGDGIEQAWGSFKLNLYYLIGMAGTTAAAFLLGSMDATGVFLNLSLTFAFATLFPNYPILLFFFFSVRVKWIALVSLFFVLMQLLAGPNVIRLVIVVSFANYLLFFGREWVRLWREQGRVAARQQKFQMAAKAEPDEALHHCKVCGRTEITAPEYEFRVAADGEEYCQTHLPSRRTGTETPPPLPQ